MRGLLTLSGSLTLLFLLSIAPSLAQAPAQADDTQSPPTFRTRTNLVLVPALVQTDKGQVVFALTAQDFSITDDGVPQKLTLEQDTDSLPLALVIVVETGAAGANRVGLYSRIGPLLDSVVGGVNHRVAVVGFDSVPRLVEDFTPDLDQVRGTMNNLKPGDDGDAIFDSLGYAVELLRKQPVQYRRAILLLSETLDHGSKMSLEDTLRAISDTNTAIYSMGFSTTRAQMKGEAKGFSDPDDPGPAGGCMSRPKKASDKETAEDDDDDDDKPYSGRDTETPPAKQKSVAAQAYDCASLLAPPLRAAKMLAIAAMNGLHRNVPESVAQLTGGEYYKFENEKSFQRGLFTIANHVPNRYVLSFQPQSPHAGLHELKVQVTDYKKLNVTARRSYWVDAETQP